MNVSRVNVNKSASCAGCLGERDRAVCKKLPACFGTDYKGKEVNFVFVVASPLNISGLTGPYGKFAKPFIPMVSP